MLPDKPGIDLLKDLRTEERTRAVPVIMLTAQGSEADRVVGLDTGADDYVVKPFSPRELVSRIRAVFRRRAPAVQRRIDRLRSAHDRSRSPRGPRRWQAGRKWDWPSSSYLGFLVSHPERVFSRTQLLDSVWGDHVFIEERTVDVHMLRLRKALAPVNAQHLVQTVRGLGYRLSMGTEH